MTLEEWIFSYILLSHIKMNLYMHNTPYFPLPLASILIALLFFSFFILGHRRCTYGSQDNEQSGPCEHCQVSNGSRLEFEAHASWGHVEALLKIDSFLPFRTQAFINPSLWNPPPPLSHIYIYVHLFSLSLTRTLSLISPFPSLSPTL